MFYSYSFQYDDFTYGFLTASDNLRLNLFLPLPFLFHSNQSSFQIQNLQQQLFAVASQRDDAVSKLSQVQDKAHQTEAALNNLQMVLEQLQRGKQRLSNLGRL